MIDDSSGPPLLYIVYTSRIGFQSVSIANLARPIHNIVKDDIMESVAHAMTVGMSSVSHIPCTDFSSVAFDPRLLVWN